jgi:peroxiredoxin/uncharacterized membrane protein YphA (DoxX/SURF4 family)
MSGLARLEPGVEMILVLGKVLLAAVFAVAAVGKLTDPSGSRQAVTDFSVPRAIAPAIAVLLPIVELGAAVLLLTSAWAWYGAIAAGSLLVLFSVAIAVSLIRGRKPDCHCFGQIAAGPIGWPTLLRNLALTSVAGFVAWTGRESTGPGVAAWLGSLSVQHPITLVVGVIGFALVIVEAWVLVRLFTQHGRILLRLEALEARLIGNGAPVVGGPQPTTGLPVGAAAPPFALSGLHGETLTLDALRAAGRPLLLVFTDPGCGPCTALLPEIGLWQREYGTKLLVPLISRGTLEQNRAKLGEHAITYVLLQKDREVAAAYRAAGTPSAVLLRPDGTIGSVVAAGADAIRQLVARTVGVPVSAGPAMAAPAEQAPSSGNGDGVMQRARPAPPKRGARAPRVALPDLAGTTVSLADWRGEPTIVLFWNPGCGFCQQMAGDLRAWEVNPARGAPKLLLVSTGSVDANRAMGFKSTMLLDQGFAVGRAFGAGGTPSAVLVNGKGRIASELMVGRPGVLALLGVSVEQPQAVASSGTPGLAPPGQKPSAEDKTTASII